MTALETLKAMGVAGLKKWADENKHLGKALFLAKAKAELTRERVDAYIKPVFDGFEFYTSAELTRRPSERITKPRDLYLCGDEELCAKYYAACDAAHRAHGFTGPTGYCPALIAETEVIDAENALLTAAVPLLGEEILETTTELRKRGLDILCGMLALALKPAK